MYSFNKMPRNSGSSCSFSSRPSFPKPSVPKTSLPLPAPVPHTSSLPMIPPVSQPPTFFQNVKDGFSFGAGAHVARHLVDRVLGSPTNPTLPPPAATPGSACAFIQNEFDQCIRAHAPDDLCQKEIDLLNKCLGKK